MKKINLKGIENSSLINILSKEELTKIYGGEGDYIVKSDGVVYDTLDLNAGISIVDDLNGLIR